MAEFVFRDIVDSKGLGDQFYIASAATSREEIGNPVHPGTRCKLHQYGISTAGKCAVQMQKKDYENYDYLIGMEQWNIRNMMRILGQDPDQKVHLLLDYTDAPRDIADPWYTGDFDQTYEDVRRGCKGLLKHIKKHEFGLDDWQI